MNRKSRRSSQQKNTKFSNLKKKNQSPKSEFKEPQSPIMAQALIHALTLKEQNNLPAAHGALQAIIAEDPLCASAHYHLGLIALSSREIEIAKICFKKASKIEPANPLPLSALSVALCDLGQTDEAFTAVHQALKITPNDPINHHRLARIYQIQGDFEHALESLREAVKCDPFFILGWVSIAELKKFKAGDPELKKMLSINKKTKHRPVTERSNINFSIGKAFYDCKDFDKSFSHYKEANKLRNSMLPDNPLFNDNLNKDIQDLKDCFTPTVIKQLENSGHKSKKPVFIIGMPRSGTTLVEQIIASHPDAYGAGELNDFNKSFNLPKNPPNPETGKSLFHNKIQSLLSPEQLFEGGQNYVNLINGIAPDAARVIDKLPFNYMWAALIRLALPNAKIIHCARNPMDTGLSIYRQNFASLMPWVWDLEKIGHAYNAYDELMAYWYELFPGKIYTAQYEAIIENQEEESRKLIEFCDLPWDDRCLHFHRAEKEVRTASIYQVRQPIYKSSLKGWRHFETQLDPLYQIVKQHMK